MGKLIRNKHAYFVSDDHYHPIFGYALECVVEGVIGRFITQRWCGHDLELAQEYASGLNSLNGIQPKDAYLMISDLAGGGLWEFDKRIT